VKKKKKMRLKSWKDEMSLLIVFLVCICISGAVCRNSGVGFDVATGGYSDVAVILSPQLNRVECPQILQDVKVKKETNSIHGQM
jgi:hypothetical protein